MLHEFSFRSYNKRDDVQAWIYVPACEHKGIVQIIHGFGEHSRRYLHMIVNLLDEGYIVAADDHVGHGKTAIINDNWGDWGYEGFHTMMEDEHTLMEITKEKYPDLPYMLFGHSMGSFIARDFMSKYGDELTAVTLCGTSGVWPDLQASIDCLKKILSDGKGKESDPTVASSLMGWMFARCDEEVTIGNEWICKDPYVQRDHAEDPLDAFTKPTTNQAFLYFCEMIDYITGPEWAAKVPTHIKIYNIAGDQDPVGQYGRGVYEVTNWLTDTGHDVKTQLYSGYRHEIHNYPDLKTEVMWNLAEFYNNVLGCGFESMMEKYTS